MTVCPKCGTQYEGNFCPNGCNSANFAQQNAAKPPKKSNKALKVILIILAVVVGIGILGSVLSKNDTESGSNSPTSDSEISSTVQNNESSTPAQTSNTVATEPADTSNNNVYNVGDTLDANGFKITFVKAEKWESDNQFITPENGKIFIRAYFTAENTSSTDRGIGSSDFECYADGSKMSQSYYGDEELDVYTSISSGRKTEGYIYFEVTQNAQDIEIEYETSWWTGKKAIFKVQL